MGTTGDKTEDKTVLDRIDVLQQRHTLAAFPVGVWLRYREDRAFEYAALLSYYGVFSLFPLLLVLVTILGLALVDNPDLRDRVLNSVFSQFPVVGNQLAAGTDSLEGNGVVLIVGILMALWAGLGVVRVAQDAFNTMWGVPIISRPTFVPKVLRSLGGLLVLGVGFAATAVVTGITAYAPDLPGIARLVGAVLSIATGAALLIALFKVLTAAPVSFRSLVPGAIVGGVFLWILQLVGGFYMSRVIANASAVYGTFATVIGLMVWMALMAKLILLAAEVNVVADKHLWPRSFNGRNLTEADERSFSDVASRDIRRA